MTLVFAHRGSSRDHPENTKAAFEHALEVGSDWVELDVRRTADGKMVIHHDPALSDGRAIVACLRDDLPPSILELADALDVCASMGVNIEIKNLPGEPDADPSNQLSRDVVALLETRPAGDEILVTSFDRSTIDAVRSLARELPVGWLLYDLAPADVASAVATAAEAGYVGINPWDPTVTEELVEQAHAAGLLVNVWTVDAPERMTALIEMGVDGIITNVPAVARNLIDGTN